MEHPLLGKSDRLIFNNFPSNSSDLEDFKTPQQKLLYHEMLVLSEVRIYSLARSTCLLYFPPRLVGSSCPVTASLLPSSSPTSTTSPSYSWTRRVDWWSCWGATRAPGCGHTPSPCSSTSRWSWTSVISTSRRQTSARRRRHNCQAALHSGI